MAAVTVTLGSHTFDAPPETTKRRSLNIAIHEIIDGVDIPAIMGRTNKEIHLGTVEVSKAAFDSLYNAYVTETELSLNIPNFEEGKTCRISQFTSLEPPMPEQTYYRVDIVVVLTT